MGQKNSVLMGTFKILEKLLNLIIFFLMTIIVVLVFSNVICRYFLGSAIAWSEEVSRFLLIWLAFFGTISAYIRNEHLGLDLVVSKLPLRIAAGVGIIANLLIAYAIWLIINGGYELALRSMDWLSPATATSYGYVYLVVPICGSVMLLQTAFKLGRHLMVLLKGEGGFSC